MKNINIKNRRASFEFEFLEEFIAGIQLKGTEIKSIRNGEVSFSDSYCFFDKNELFVKNLSISEYKHASFAQHDPKRNRKLLLTKRELKKLQSKTQEKGLTIIPSRIFINEKGFAKMVIVLARGKKKYDKRQSLKIKDLKREVRENS